MTTISHRPPRESWLSKLDVPEMWPSLAIITIWLAVLFDAVFGPDITTVSAGSTTSVPSAVPVAFFAFLATSVLGWRAFRGNRT